MLQTPCSKPTRPFYRPAFPLGKTPPEPRVKTPHPNSFAFIHLPPSESLPETPPKNRPVPSPRVPFSHVPFPLNSSSVVGRRKRDASTKLGNGLSGNIHLEARLTHLDETSSHHPLHLKQSLPQNPKLAGQLIAFRPWLASMLLLRDLTVRVNSVLEIGKSSAFSRVRGTQARDRGKKGLKVLCQIDGSACRISCGGLWLQQPLRSSALFICGPICGGNQKRLLLSRGFNI